MRRGCSGCGGSSADLPDVAYCGRYQAEAGGVAPEKVVTAPPSPTPPIASCREGAFDGAQGTDAIDCTTAETQHYGQRDRSRCFEWAQTPEPPKLTAEQKSKLDELEPQIDQLNNWASAVNNSLNTMQRSMQKVGLALRGDIVSRQMSMNTNLGKAKQAFAQQDLDRASRYATLTEADVEAARNIFRTLNFY